MYEPITFRLRIWLKPIYDNLYDRRSLARSRSDEVGAGIARKLSVTAKIVSFDDLFHRDDDADPTNITACRVPSGIVATIRARRGNSVCVLCDKVEKLKSMVR
jgi:hypothetical protein